MSNAVDHPPHYGGADNPYEVIKVIEAWKLGFNLGNAVKYIGRESGKGAPIQDLEKAVWYLRREIENRRMDAARVAKMIDQQNVNQSISAAEQLNPLTVQK
jgi:hypothetical protein